MHIFEMGRGEGMVVVEGGGVIVNENGRHCQTKLIQQIIISYLIN